MKSSTISFDVPRFGEKFASSPTRPLMQGGRTHIESRDRLTLLDSEKKRVTVGDHDLTVGTAKGGDSDHPSWASASLQSPKCQDRGSLCRDHGQQKTGKGRSWLGPRSRVLQLGVTARANWGGMHPWRCERPPRWVCIGTVDGKNLRWQWVGRCQNLGLSW